MLYSTCYVLAQYLKISFINNGHIVEEDKDYTLRCNLYLSNIDRGSYLVIGYFNWFLSSIWELFTLTNTISSQY